MNVTEISQEERDLWRFEASDECGTPSEEDERILRLLSALDTAEAERKKDIAHCKFEFDRAEKAEANVARLTKERDWLAMHLSGYDDQKKCTVYAADWKEAARRAVAAGEEICQK